MVMGCKVWKNGRAFGERKFLKSTFFKNGNKKQKLQQLIFIKLQVSRDNRIKKQSKKGF